MTIEINKNEQEIIIAVCGRLDTVTAPVLEQRIGEIIIGVKTLILDFEGLEYISSAGLRVLLGTQKKIQKSGSMKLIHVCEEVMEVFEMTGFADILTIE